MTHKVYDCPYAAAKAWARLHGIWSSQYGHLYAPDAETHRRLPPELRGTGKIWERRLDGRHLLALRMPGRNPRYDKTIQGYARLADQLQRAGLIEETEGGWQLTSPVLPAA